ncbi:MAG: UDP-N-acetylmuramate dehydrogenase [Cyanobacteria bacterium P01_H01_bin.74]
MSNTAVCAPQQVMGAQFSTYRIGGPLDEAYLPETEPQLLHLLDNKSTHDAPLTIIGWGGNVIIASAGIRGKSVITRKLSWINAASEMPDAFWCGAGAHLAKVSNAALSRNLTGAEYMIGIPGTVGGAIRMNAGALGQDTGNVVQRVKLYNWQTHCIEEWLPDDLEFAYRRSAILPEKHLILSALLAFKPGDPEKISETMKKSVHFRKTNHPKEPSGGSVFKNPSPKMPVGRLMDELGAKGHWRDGGVMVSPLHGNFIINTGEGTSTQLLRLMWRMKKAIYEAYGLNVSPENLLIGDIAEEELLLWHALQKPLESVAS